MRHGQRTFQPDNKEDRHTFTYVVCTSYGVQEVVTVNNY